MKTDDDQIGWCILFGRVRIRYFLSGRISIRSKVKLLLCSYGKEIYLTLICNQSTNSQLPHYVPLYVQIVHTVYPDQHYEKNVQQRCEEFERNTETDRIPSEDFKM